MAATGTKVGFIGLGTMGGPIATRLQRAGCRLVVHDTRREAASRHLEAGATWADTPRALGEASEVVFTALPGPPEVEAVVLGPDGLAAGLRSGACLFDLSTNTPEMVRRLHAELGSRGGEMLDAPVSGGPRGAANGRLAVWVGGDRELFDHHRDLLGAFAEHAIHIGPIGSGTVAKLVHNASAYAVNCALAETFSLGVKAGLDPLALFEAVRAGAGGRRRTFDIMIDQFLPGRYEPAAFALRLAHKDVSLAASLGRELGVPLRFTNLALAELTEALNRGWAERDARCVMLLQQERTNIDIAVEQERLDELLARDPPSRGDPKHGQGDRTDGSLGSRPA